MSSKLAAASQNRFFNSRDFDDDDFQISPSQIPSLLTPASRNPLTASSQKISIKSSNNLSRQSKKRNSRPNPGKENVVPATQKTRSSDFDLLEGCCSLDSIPSSLDCSSSIVRDGIVPSDVCHEKKGVVEINRGYLCNSIESRLVRSRLEPELSVDGGGSSDEIDEEKELDALLQLCDEVEEEEIKGNDMEKCWDEGVNTRTKLNRERRKEHEDLHGNPQI